jgi:hypothetical protein
MRDFQTIFNFTQKRLKEKLKIIFYITRIELNQKLFFIPFKKVSFPQIFERALQNCSVIQTTASEVILPLQKFSFSCHSPNKTRTSAQTKEKERNQSANKRALIWFMTDKMTLKVKKRETRKSE